ncbi:MAG TPA: S9 family peptidase [Opitutaceae bacterium]|nr:S9 family peptidase [Opitutaceae bacterium]
MQLPRLCLLAALQVVTIAARAVDRLPIENFTREPDVSRVRLSPDGKSFAYLREHLGLTRLHIGETDGNNVLRLDIGGAGLANGAAKEVGHFEWVSERRLLAITTVWDALYGVMAIDRDGTHQVAISGYEDDKAGDNNPKISAREVIHRFYDKPQRVLMLERHDLSIGSRNRPDVLMVDTSTGLSSTLIKNPGEVGGWAVDSEGVVRLGLLSHGELSGAIYRENEKTPWRTILPLENRKGQMRTLGFDSGRQQVFIAGLTPEKRWALLLLDPANAAISPPLLANPEYDILPERFVPSIDGVALAAPIFPPRRDRLLGVRYVADAPRVKWFDPEFARNQVAVDRALPNTTNLLVDISLDGKRTLWFGFSDQHPGAYFLADAEKRTFKQLAPRMSWIKPEQMAPMLAIKYTARDGLLVHGFLTVPAGHQPKGLPLVVMPHGGPWVRDVWGFDPLVQLLANRGYAVLQMNYRGSPGYGEELYQNAKRQIGGKIQDDIEDATRWAIAAKIADPARIAIFGMSYGGYSALFALGQNPELYRCGISMAGVTDWPAIYNNSDAAEYKESRRYWREQIGDPDKDAERLKTISPVNFAGKITAPVLIIQGKEDRRVPPDQARRMISALEKAGRKPESLFLADVGHNFGRQNKRTELFGALVTFLEKNLGPGVP